MADLLLGLFVECGQHIYSLPTGPQFCPQLFSLQITCTQVHKFVVCILPMFALPLWLAIV